MGLQLAEVGTVGRVHRQADAGRHLKPVPVHHQRFVDVVAQFVGHRQGVTGKALDPELALLLDILLGPSAHVLRLGQGPELLVLEVGLLGLELLDELQNQRPGLPVAVLSASEMDGLTTQKSVPSTR